jgi:hypothetical protein
MAEIVSLKSKRKAKARAEKQQTAAENRTIYGATKAEKKQRAAEAKLAADKLNAHKKHED